MAETKLKKSLHLVFKSAGVEITLNVSTPSESLADADIKAAMDVIEAKKIFGAGDLTSDNAYYKTRTTQELEIM